MVWCSDGMLILRDNSANGLVLSIELQDQFGYQIPAVFYFIYSYLIQDGNLSKWQPFQSMIFCTAFWTISVAFSEAPLTIPLERWAADSADEWTF